MSKEKVDPRKEEYTKNFKLELIRFIKDSKLEDLIITQKINEIETLFQDKIYLTGKLFYDLYKKHNFNITLFCKKVFTLSKAQKLSPTTAHNNPLALLLNPFLNSQKEFYTRADIGSSRLNRILNPEKHLDLYADEVYGIATAIGIEPLILFEYFFEKEKHSAFDLALKILELYISKEDNSAEKEVYKEVYKLTDNQKKIIAEITENKNITIKELACTVGINDKNIQKNLKQLKDDGLVKRVGSKISGYWEVVEPENEDKTE